MEMATARQVTGVATITSCVRWRVIGAGQIVSTSELSIHTVYLRADLVTELSSDLTLVKHLPDDSAGLELASPIVAIT